MKMPETNQIRPTINRHRWFSQWTTMGIVRKLFSTLHLPVSIFAVTVTENHSRGGFSLTVGLFAPPTAFSNQKIGQTTSLTSTDNSTVSAEH
jgi:hypothetical protein